MGDNVWQEVFKSIFSKNLTLNSEEVNAEEINKEFEQNSEYPVIKAGEIEIISGHIEIGDPLCYMNTKYSCTLEKKIPKGVYPLYLSIMDHPVFGPKFLTAKMDISGKVPVRYELAKAKHLNEEQEKEALPYFGVDTGLACICDKEVSVAYDKFLQKWHEEHPGKNHYDDYFAEPMKQYARDFPEYQREDGDYFNFKLPDTTHNLLMFTSGFGDGAYRAFWGYDEDGKIACLIIPFIHPKAYDVPMPEIKKEKEFFLKPEDIKELIDSDMFCVASDKIMVEGLKVGYMSREEPNKTHPNDSGWMFYEGTEDDDYLNDSYRFGVYHINTVANYDKDIIPLLSAPVGTAFYRDENGDFYEDDNR